MVLGSLHPLPPQVAVPDQGGEQHGDGHGDLDEDVEPVEGDGPGDGDLGPWVATWSHWTRAATRAAIEVTEATRVPVPTPRILRNREDTTISATAPPIMISMGRMLR